MNKTAILLSILIFSACTEKQQSVDVPKKATSNPEFVASVPLPEIKEKKLASIDLKLSSCVDSLLATKSSISKWEDGLKLNCLKLNKEEQEIATQYATEKTDGEITFWLPSEVIGEFNKGKLPYMTKEGSEAEEHLALLGNYQAQRNYAYSIYEKNPIKGCAYRIVIIKSGHTKMDQTDVNNLKIYCGKLDDISIKAAENQAAFIIKTIQSNSKI